MKLIDRYTFTNGKAFETWYLDANDVAQLGIPECDVIGFVRADSDPTAKRPMIMMRPDEALILARLLIGAVHQVSEGYKVGPPTSDFNDGAARLRETMRDLGVSAIVGQDLSRDRCDSCGCGLTDPHEAWCRYASERRSL